MPRQDDFASQGQGHYYTGRKLTDKHMIASQKLLKQLFTSIEGLCTTLKVTTCSYTTWIPNYLQIFYTRSDHWIKLTTIGCGNDHICDSICENPA